LGSIGLSVTVMIYARDHENQIAAVIRRVGLLGPVLVIALYGLLGASPIPSEPLTVINGVLFGPFLGTIIAGTGNTLAAIVEYFLGSKIGDAADFEEKRHDLPLGLGRLPVDSVWFLLGGRMVPGYGAKVVSIMGGLYGVSMWRYVWTTALPTFVGAAIFAYGGFEVLKLL
jgi:uncharacterized membrane protein YdjX (TVP38/TMEM64 family)